MENNKKTIFELFIDENDHDNVLDIISFVNDPAIERGFMYFNKDVKKKLKFKATDNEKRIVTGPAMIPNMEIIRYDDLDNPYFVYFEPDTIIKCAEVFAKYGRTNVTNYNHDIGLRDVTVMESWIVVDEKNDKSNALGFQDIPKGSWMVSYKVDNDDLWESVKSGEVMGFSIEGIFSQRLIEMSKANNIDSTYNKIKSIVNDDKLNDDEKYNKLSKLL